MSHSHMATSLRLYRFCTHGDLKFCENLSGVFAFRPRKPVSVKCCSADEPPADSSSFGSDFDAKKFRHDLTRSENYNRRGFGLKEETLEFMNQAYTSDIIETLKENRYEYTWGNVTVKLAKAYGFCWGVEQAVRIAFEARKQFPEKKIWITNEIIHNPTVNKHLEEMEVQNLPIDGGKKQFDVVDTDDVVILPAFGASVEEMYVLSKKNVQIVDTTCPWVSKVWNTVEKHKKGDYTSIIHGKYSHEETVATASFAGKYVILKNMKEKRQDAMYNLVDEKLDLVLVVGGWNSSNTSHLQEIAEDRGIPSYWVDTEKRIGPGNKIAYKLMHGELVEKENWLPEGPITIGVTSGASTPDKELDPYLVILLAVLML
ncbi:hypothetical protein LWI28_023942 [Acer negundo]|uniref:4-hydroxy-3-methylbut-2-enyl diphosphate reductase n=1 Tax=Acer negundo TaxID=4023 RepID=A0AAD5J5Z8_ACENE|nr:hypothetical protein LWI28_023942 [Acer negundo]